MDHAVAFDAVNLAGSEFHHVFPRVPDIYICVLATEFNAAIVRMTFWRESSSDESATLIGFDKGAECFEFGLHDLFYN